MKKLVLFLVLFLGITAAYAQTTESLWDKLPKASGYINDFEHLFTDAQKEEINDLLRHFEIETSVEIAVVTISPANTPKERFEELTLHIANQWGVGKKGKDNGILIGISSGYHRIRIQNGKGIITVLSDADTKKIIDDAFIPEFQKNDYFSGTVNGLKEIMNLLKQHMKK
ncbi:TPM domain-containing protein [Flavobacterium psychrotrophum]|uniref:TPM domain-containing protein n=1 Tax=Flavobacterium psychrotrophum TaxID=2294119 RepID=UPI000E320F48|nr:TPM domain-containing protein [Flavobacterium psychrotrophum]